MGTPFATLFSRDFFHKPTTTLHNIYAYLAHLAEFCSQNMLVWPHSSE